MERLTIFLAVSAMAMFFLDVHAFRTPVRPIAPRTQIPVEPVGPVLLLSKIQEIVRDVRKLGKNLDIVGNSNPAYSTVLLIMLNAACQKLKDQGVNPLPDYCYIKSANFVQPIVRPRYTLVKERQRNRY
ncbi:uncharacterized protein LOC121390350 [Gigantopelta aegis]|uniref:uncharacterized protein LOC121390350 n=1 Tax=Gigantopelta aegis TaxID=1735272 RepID=UPI001B88B3EA|nr:uncharacterized protein LOC121390350 [Gigantopelta aegis]